MVEKRGTKMPERKRDSTILSDTQNGCRPLSLFLYQEWEDKDTELDHEERREKEGEVEKQRERSSRKGDVMG